MIGNPFRLIRAWMPIAAAGLAGTALYVAGPQSGLASNGLFFVLRATATGIYLAGIRVDRSAATRRPWELLGLGMLCTLAGDVLEGFTLEENTPTFPGPPDAFYLAAAALTMWALVKVVRIRNPLRDLGAGLDATLGAVGASFFVFGAPAWLDITTESTLRILGAALYPALDILTIGLLVRIAISPRTQAWPAAMIGTAFIVLTYTDVRYGRAMALGTYESGTIDDVGFLLYPWALAATIWHPRHAELTTPPPAQRAPFGLLRVTFVIAAIAAVPMMILLDAERTEPLGFGWFATGTVVIATTGIWRSSLMIRYLNDAANSDTSTRLPGRAALTHQLNTLIEHARERTVLIWVIKIPILRTIGETYGPHVGDQVSIEAVGGMNDVIDADDVLGRWDTDTFVMARPIGHAAKNSAVGPRLMRNLSYPVDTDAGPLMVTVHVNRHDVTDPATDIATLIESARIATQEPPTDPLHRALLHSYQTRPQDFQIRYQMWVERRSGDITGVTAGRVWESGRYMLAGAALDDAATACGFGPDHAADTIVATTEMLERTWEIAHFLHAQIRIRADWLLHPQVQSALLDGSVRTSNRISALIPEEDLVQDPGRQRALLRLGRHEIPIIARLGNGPMSLRLASNDAIAAVAIDIRFDELRPGTVHHAAISALSATARASGGHLLAMNVTTAAQQRQCGDYDITYCTDWRTPASINEEALRDLLSTRPSRHPLDQ